MAREHLITIRFPFPVPADMIMRHAVKTFTLIGDVRCVMPFQLCIVFLGNLTWANVINFFALIGF